VEYQQGSNLTDLPEFSTSPVYQILPIGATAVFSATMTQSCLSGYQWDRDGASIAGATNLTLTLTNVQLSSNGLYRVKAYGPTTTNYASARLVVLDAPAWTIWTNYITQTNNKSIHLWTNAVGTTNIIWNTNCLLYGKTGYTAISLSNNFSFQGKFAPITALTKRHGFTAAHALTEVPFDGLSHEWTKVWFVTADNQLRAITNRGAYVRYTNGYDYAVFILAEDLPDTITPMSVTNPPSSIGVLFRKGQFGYMSANAPPFDFGDTSRPPFNDYSTAIKGDSGSPNMVPTTDGSLVFIGGISTSGALSEQMRQDMDFLCTNMTYNLGLNITNYQLNWHTNYP
jgi:hypothetical protein